MCSCIGPASISARGGGRAGTVAQGSGCGTGGTWASMGRDGAGALSRRRSDGAVHGNGHEARWIDYVILAVTSALIGLIFAIRPEPVESSELATATERQGTRTIWGGFVSFLAVGCPVCNQAVVALVRR